MSRIYWSNKVEYDFFPRKAYICHAGSQLKHYSMSQFITYETVLRPRTLTVQTPSRQSCPTRLCGCGQYGFSFVTHDTTTIAAGPLKLLIYAQRQISHVTSFLCCTIFIYLLSQQQHGFSREQVTNYFKNNSETIFCYHAEKVSRECVVKPVQCEASESSRKTRNRSSGTRMVGNVFCSLVLHSPGKLPAERPSHLYRNLSPRAFGSSVISTFGSSRRPGGSGLMMTLPGWTVSMLPRRISSARNALISTVDRDSVIALQLLFLANSCTSVTSTNMIKILIQNIHKMHFVEKILIYNY